METKNFERFLKEDYTEIEKPGEEISDASKTPETSDTPDTSMPDQSTPSDTTVDQSTPASPVGGLPAAGEGTSKALYLYGGVDSLNNAESTLLQAMNQLSTALVCCTPEIVKLYQLNIQPASSDGSPEPADGMSFIYEKIADADVVIFVSPVQDGDVSSLTQTLLKRLSLHYKNMELKNKIFAALLMGDANSSQLVKADLANQANNLGFIVAPGTTVFDVAQIQTLVQAVQEIKDATSSIRSAAPVNTSVPGVLNFDQFTTQQTTANVDLNQPSKVETDTEKGDSFDVVSDTDQTPSEETPGEETTGTGEKSGEETPEASEEGGEEESGEEAPAEEEGGEEEGNEESEEEEEELRKYPKPLLSAIMKSKSCEEEEEIEEIKNESADMKVHHIARFSEIKTDKTKNDFMMKVDNKKMSSGSINTGNVKKEIAPGQKEIKGKTETSSEVKPKPDSSKMTAGKGDPNKGARSLGKEENGDVKTAKTVKKSVENFADFSKRV